MTRRGRREYPQTPDGRYFVAKGRLWRRTNPALSDTDRRAAIKALMRARRAVFEGRKAGDPEAVQAARDKVDAAKRRLGERGPVWWSDDEPDEGGRHPRNTRYAAWWQALPEDARRAGEGRDG